MNVSPLALGLAALVVLVVFGPKRLPSFKSNKQSNQIDLTSMMPSQPAAGRAPSPLAQSLGTPSTPPPAATAPTPPRQQYAMSGQVAAQPQQPHAPQPLRLPDNL